MPVTARTAYASAMPNAVDSAPEANSALPEPGRVGKERYVSAAFAELERERIWPRVWLHAAAVDVVAKPGRFVRVELAGNDVLVVRGADDEIRAFHNVCQHRGSRLVDAPRGEVRTLRCPLHHWQWSTEGAPLCVPDCQVFGSLLEELPGLSPIVSDTWGGQVWVHLGVPDQSLHAWLAPAVEAFSHYELEHYALVEQASFNVPCNWKTAADQFNEAYHVRTIHPYLMGAVDDTSVCNVVHGPHVFSSFRVGVPARAPR